MTEDKPTLVLVPGLMCDATAWGVVPEGLPQVNCKVVDHGQADSLVQMAGQLLAQALRALRWLGIPWAVV